MSFTELNAVEHFIIHQLSGVNLNVQHLEEPQAGYKGIWKYVPSNQLNRGVNEVLVESDLREV